MKKYALWSSFFYEDSPEETLVKLMAGGFRHMEFSTEHCHILMARGEISRHGNKFKLFMEAQ